MKSCESRHLHHLSYRLNVPLFCVLNSNAYHHLYPVHVVIANFIVILVFYSLTCIFSVFCRDRLITNNNINSYWREWFRRNKSISMTRKQNNMNKLYIVLTTIDWNNNCFSSSLSFCCPRSLSLIMSQLAAYCVFVVKLGYHRANPSVSRVNLNWNTTGKSFVIRVLQSLPQRLKDNKRLAITTTQENDPHR